MTKLRRTLIAPLAATALMSSLGACGASTSTAAGTSTSSSSAGASSSAPSSGPPSGFPSGGPGGPGGPGGGLQTFTAVDLNTNGQNATGANTAAVAKATSAFLATLSAKERSTVTYAYSDNQSRQTWSNYPAAQVPRKGIALSKLTAASKAAAMKVVKTMLSAQGYAQVEAIQEADDWLRANSASGTDSFGSDTDYYIAVYGTPSTSQPFMVQFGGHHLARNYSYNGTTVSVTPAFSGTEPKSFSLSGTSVEPLKQKAGALFGLFGSLTASQQSQAKLSQTINDILMGPGVDSGKFPTSAGLPVSSLTNAQRIVCTAYSGLVPMSPKTTPMAPTTSGITPSPARDRSFIYPTYDATASSAG